MKISKLYKVFGIQVIIILMYKIAALGSLAVLAAARKHPIRSDIVDTLDKVVKSWESHSVESNPLKNYSADHLLGLLGTHPTPSNGEDNYVAPEVDLLDSYNFNEAHKECAHEIRDQAQCGSCWAFGASEAFTDRFCLASEGKINVVFSPQDMVSCDTIDFGCSGGYMYFSWFYLQNSGIVSDDCFPYQSQSGKAPACTKTCADGSDFKKYYCKNGSIVNPKKVDDIKKEIQANGPVEGAFTVYEDFYSYKSGVYQHLTGSQLGGHAIKILGWGNEDGLDYWLIANSWGSGWGMNGYFKIKQGDCGINDQVYACTPDVDRALKTEPVQFF